MEKAIEQLKKLYTQRKALDSKISSAETKLVSLAKAAAKGPKVSRAKKTVKRVKSSPKPVR
ncbi:MAG: hypothetical protein LBE02_05700 [Spirochaetaceae bacterium]|jgi:hypothetical protein|nr:hypothetical protein [Spirochaetaceae bacterium]